MLPRLSPSSPCSSCCSRFPRPRSASSTPDHDLRGAARAARRPPRATATLDEIQRLRRRPRSACSSTGSSFAPAPTSKTQAGLQRHRPRRLPGRDVGPARRAVRRRRGARHRASSSRSPARCPKWATASKKDNVTKPSPKEFQAFATAVGRRYGDRVGAVVDLERAQPPGLPQAAVRAQEGAVAAASTASSSSPASAGCAPRATASDTLLFGETAPRGTPRVVAPARLPARRAVPEPLATTAVGSLRADRGRRLRPPRLHDARRPALPPARQGRRHDRRALAA